MDGPGSSGEETSSLKEALRPAHSDSQPGMSMRDANTWSPRMARKPSELVLVWIALAALLVTGCRTPSPRADKTVVEASVQQTYRPRYLAPERCHALLSPLGLEKVEPGPSANLLLLQGTPDQRKRALRILEIADNLEDYCVERLGPASHLATLPSNQQIAAALGGLRIGTFDDPPAGGAGPRAIIDIQGDAVLAFLPVRYRAPLRRLLSGDRVSARLLEMTPRQGEPNQVPPGTPGPAASSVSQTQKADDEAASRQVLIASMGERQSPQPAATPNDRAASRDAKIENTTAAGPAEAAPPDNTLPKTTRIVFTPGPTNAALAQTRVATKRVAPDNGEDTLDLTLPETMTVMNLLDLTGKYLGLNYVYDPRDVGNQTISLKLHGNLQGEMKVKHLYTLLETVLHSKGLAMIRQEQDLVAIVSLEKALQTQPELINAGSPAVQVGDTLVIRVFEIRCVDAASVKTLLENMKLVVAATPLEGSNLLLVTCHADRMGRIEQLVAMIDRPGTTRECRLRRLSYVTATPLLARLRTAAQQIQTIDVTTATTTPKPGPQPPTFPPRPADPTPKATVYLDADERTNRILMVGSEDQLRQIEELIDVLDVGAEDPRSPHLYRPKHLKAQQALDKLRELEVLKPPSIPTAPPGKNASEYVPTAEPLVAVLEGTNQLLIQATPDQYARILEFLGYIDVPLEDERTIVAYEIQHIDAQAARKILADLDLVTVETVAASPIAGPNQPAVPRNSSIPVTQTAGRRARSATVVVSKSTNALLVTATAEQHARLARIIRYIDAPSPQDEETFQMYPLESSSPEHLAAVLERILVGTTKSKDGKIERTPKTEERITIVPDPNTFSLIVYANYRNQRRIEELVRKLDRRRPQVLIDVTLVEITRSDTFEYDLSVVGRANGPVTGNLVANPIQTADSSARLEAGYNLPDRDGNPTGQLKAFYSDRNIQALLTVMQRKNYGRVLAKPRVLVDDGHKGQITTKDTTTYVKESIQIPQTGTPITTRDFVPIEASIKLHITPHISEGNLLRLDVYMSRDDFGTRPLSVAPPDKATSEVTTTVFVPDDRTVILGGLVRLNQSKAGSKVPLLGDIPLLGVLFRSTNNSNVEKKLYVFLKANIVRPYDGSGLSDLEQVSRAHEEAFEESEAQFQRFEAIPGIRPKPMQPENVLGDYK
jgi:type II secretory pathway component GspD/PulD (secretin)